MFRFQAANPGGAVVAALGPYSSKSTALADAQELADNMAGRAQVYVVPHRDNPPEVTYPAPAGLVAERRRGLRWYDQGHGGRGLVPATIEAAREIVKTRRISQTKREAMGPWLRRHADDLEALGARPGEKGYPSPGRVAWALWGGDPAWRWIGSKGDRPWRYPPRRQNKAPASDTPARPHERLRGSDRNRPGSAVAGGTVRLSAATDRALAQKARQHNRSDPPRLATPPPLRPEPPRSPDTHRITICSVQPAAITRALGSGARPWSRHSAGCS